MSVTNETKIDFNPDTLSLAGAAGSTITSQTVTPAAATGGRTVASVNATGVPAGISVVFNAGVITISGTPAAAGSGTFEIEATDSSGDKTTMTVSYNFTSPTPNPGDGGSEDGGSNVPVTGVTLDRQTLPLTTGGSFTLTVTFTPSNATNQSVTWKSSDTSVATVDQNGKVTAAGPGTCVITATTTDGGKVAECTVTVTAPTVVTGITLNRTVLTLKPGQTFSLIATISPENATNKNVTWTSTYPGRVAVDENGKITTVALGTAVITVTTEDGKFFASCMVLVSDTEIAIDFSDLKLEDGVLKLEPGQEVDVTIIATPEGVTFKATGLPEGLTLTEDGHLYGYAPTEEGTYTITVTATASDGTEVNATFTVTVRDGEVIVTPSDGGSSGGCNAAGGIIALLPLVLLGLRRSRKS